MKDTFSLTADPTFKYKALKFAAGYNYAAYFDSCNSPLDRYGKIEWLAAWAGSEARCYQNWEELSAGFARESYKIGAFSYELKDRFEPSLSSGHPLPYSFPELYFFEPEAVILKYRDSDQVQIWGEAGEDILQRISEEDLQACEVREFSGFSSNFTQAEYIKAIQALRQHIKDGDSYEINLSQLFSADLVVNSVAALFRDLVAVSPNPFATYVRWKDLHLLSASPERFLQLDGQRIRTQPIKGTAPRYPDPVKDKQSALALRNSIKEQAENVMIVDLSRNDLYRSCQVNSVEVPYLFEVQSFPQVHHLVSTIEGIKKEELTPLQVIQNTFPPGSMTGAPKVRSCQLIEQYEKSQRGIYSGAAGIFDPQGNFDLNIVIRSLILNESQQKVWYHVGGAITYDSAPAAEYEETILKAKGITELFAGLAQQPHSSE